MSKSSTSFSESQTSQNNTKFNSSKITALYEWFVSYCLGKSSNSNPKCLVNPWIISILNPNFSPTDLNIEANPKELVAFFDTIVSKLSQFCSSFFSILIVKFYESQQYNKNK